MSNDEGNGGEQPKRLTIDDPVSPDALQQLGHLFEARGQLCERGIMLDQEKIQVLAAIKRLDDQKTRLFEAILVERDLTPQTQVEIDKRTGKLKLLQPPEQPPPEESGKQPSEAS